MCGTPPILPPRVAAVLLLDGCAYPLGVPSPAIRAADGCRSQARLPLHPNNSYKLTWRVAPPAGDGTQRWAMYVTGNFFDRIDVSGPTCTLPPSQCWQTFTATVVTPPNPMKYAIEFVSR